ncbi:DHA2 family efflux MFS transporter permease subunit [Stenotrophobium rhamnosiphilum]|nr:DHA2 family efflux MFS transporter permease subunit [Stenotrophobium rhamnosiphilum]
MSDTTSANTDLPSPPNEAMLAAARAKARRNWFGFFAMAFGVFMAFLDIQIVASSLNQIRAGLTASIQEIAWVQSAYLIAEVIAIPLSGYLSRIFSTRVYFTISALGFTIASAACAMAWNIESMIVFRALQGFLGGGMIPSAFAALYIMFPPEKRIVPQVITGLIATSAPILGPVLGGYITEISSWHWLFLINLVPGLLIAAAVWSLVDIDRPQPELWKVVDIPGVLTMAAFLGATEWVLEEGPAKNWFDDSTIIFWAAFAAASGALFFYRVLTFEHPIVDLRPFKNMHFACANLAAMLLSVSLFAGNYILPLFLGQVRGYNSQQIGETLMVTGAAMFLVAPFCARLARTMDLRVMFGIGCSLVALGSWNMANLTQDTGFWELALPQFLRGAGLMMALVCCSTLSFSTLPASAVKNASGLYSLMRNLGGAFGLAAINTIMYSRQALHDRHLLESLTVSRTPVRDFFTNIPALPGTHDYLVAVARIMQTVQTQATILSYNDAIIAITWVGCFTIPLFMLVSRPNINNGPPIE